MGPITHAIGIDLGGTRIKAIMLDERLEVVRQAFLPTKDGTEQIWKEEVLQIVKQFTEEVPGGRFAVGISAPGLPSDDHSYIAHMPGRMQGLENFLWSLHLRVGAHVLNDAVAAMLAESRLGAARQFKHVVMLTLGTGVGGALLINGEPYMGSFLKAGHIGHMVIDWKGEPDVTGMPGSLEDAIGNVTIEKRSGGRYKSTDHLISDCRKKDQLAISIWEESVQKLAIGLASITNILSPELIVLGGGIAEAGEFLFKPLEEHMERYEWRAGGDKVKIVKAEFSDLSGAIGAACFAMEKENKIRNQQ